MVDYAELAANVDAHIGESPLWDHRSGQLIFVDVTAGVLHRYEPSTGSLHSSEGLGQEIGAAVPRAGGGLVLAARDGIATVEADGGGLEWIAPVEADKPSNRMNDAKCDASGRLWAGTIAFDFASEAGALYCIDRDHSYRTMVSGVTVSNGLGWSPDKESMYYIDSRRKTVDVFRFELDTGSISDRKELIRFGDDDGKPDGMTVDAEGYVWVACLGAGAVRRFRPSGELDGEVEVPAQQVTSCGFGGPDLEQLYITTANFVLSPEQRGHVDEFAGGLFVYSPGVRGLHTDFFGG